MLIRAGIVIKPDRIKRGLSRASNCDVVGVAEKFAYPEDLAKRDAAMFFAIPVCEGRACCSAIF
jgi:hypothetical protein